MNRRVWWLPLALMATAGCHTQRVATVPRTVVLQSQAGALVGTVHLEPGTAPALWPLRTIDGVEVTRAFPFSDDREGESHDHPHHRSMWAAHGDVNGVDFWHGDGRIEHDAVDVMDGEVVIHGRWLDAHGKVLLRSTLSYRVLDEGNTRNVDMQLVLSGLNELVVFGDTKEGTLAIRLAPQLRVDGAVASGTLANSEGVSGGSVWGQVASWIKVTGDIDGQTVAITLTYAAHVEEEPEAQAPACSASVVRWHARTYGLIAANPFGERAFVGSGEAKETRLEPGQRLVLTLRVEVQ